MAKKIRRINFVKISRHLREGKRLPRKLKKRVIGERMNKKLLKWLNENYEVILPARTCYERPLIIPFTFCPNCGCMHEYSTGNKVALPEVYEYFHCYRCKKITAVIDNSPYTHILVNKTYFE